MAEIVNFRRAKKAKARAEDEKRAETNRAKFGTPKAERDLLKAETEKAQREHLQNKLEKE
jgi:hypothetical protein